MKLFLSLLIAAIIAGCASTLTVREFDKDGNVVRTIVSNDYTFKDRDVTASPTNWWNSRFLSDLFKGLDPILVPLVGGGSTPTPGPTPYPAPAPQYYLLVPRR